MSLQQLIEQGVGLTDVKPSQKAEVADKLQIMLRNYIDLVNKGEIAKAEELYAKEEKELLESL